jgi:hypothetical protein
MPQPTPADWAILARHGITPDNLSLGGWLDLRGCTGLTALPDNLSLGGPLDLSGCTGLTALPDNLSVGGGLYLRGCGAARHLLTDDRGYQLWHAANARREWFSAGCRTFTRAEALAHWGSPDYPDPELGAAFVAAINATPTGG